MEQIERIKTMEQHLDRLDSLYLFHMQDFVGKDNAKIANTIKTGAKKIKHGSHESCLTFFCP